MPEGDAERIRNYLVTEVEQVRGREETEISFRFAKIVNDLGLHYPDACIDIRQVLDTQLFQRQARVASSVHVSGPREGQDSVYSCHLL